MALLDEQIDGKYEILEKIREGGMGAIYRVRHRLLDEIRVVKVIRSQAEPSSEASDRFLREAKAAIKLRHPNIAVLHDFAVAGDGQAFIVMEFIDGWNLQEILTGYGPPPLGMTLELSRQSLKALGYLHRHKIVHRDVSPDNLMVTRDVEGHLLVKLIDLGIAKNLEGAGGLTTTGVFLGKPRYGSPERFTGEGWDERSDLYSFGVVLYELLTGRCPILGNEPAALMAGHLFRAPIAFDETDRSGRVPPELRAAVLKVLEKKPDDRFANAEAFVAALREVQARCPIDRGDLDAVWAVLQPIGAHFGSRANPAGSTQFRLDQEFGVLQTPARGIIGSGPATARTDAPKRAETLGSLPLHAEPTQALPASLGLAGAMGEATRRTVAPASEAGVVVPFPGGIESRESRESLEGGESVEPVDLDATWARRPLRKEAEARAKAPLPLPPASPAAALVASRSAQQRHPGRSAPVVAVLVVLAALAIGGGWLWRSRGGRPEAPPQSTVDLAAVSSPTPDETEAAGAPPAGGKAPGGAGSPARPPKPARESAGSRAKAAAVEGWGEEGAGRKERRRLAPAGLEGPVFVPPMKIGDLITREQPAVEEPEVRELGTPVYPAAARGSGKSLIVRVQVLVDQTGHVINTRMPRPDLSGLGFDEAAREAARHSTFFPAKREGIPGQMWTDVDFEVREPQIPR